MTKAKRLNIFRDSNFKTEISKEKPGAYHMARDLELTEKLRDDPNAPNTLRLYTWDPYCISLGYQQDDSVVDRDACAIAHIDIVRRPTGGRAVYHAEELTYAAIMRFEPGEGIYAVHNKIAESLLTLLQPICNNELELSSPTKMRLQADNQVAASIREAYKLGTITNIACFMSTARYEITWKGKKVVGSAQRRFGNSLLQHGSILLGDEHSRLGEFLKITTSEKNTMRKMLEEETATISKIRGSAISFNDIMHKLNL